MRDSQQPGEGDLLLWGPGAQTERDILRGRGRGEHQDQPQGPPRRPARHLGVWAPGTVSGEHFTLVPSDNQELIKFLLGMNVRDTKLDCCCAPV